MSSVQPANGTPFLVKFSGVCTHFEHSTVPGVPHRAVLPDASAVRFGSVQPPTGDRASYCLMPHLAFAAGTEHDPNTNTDKAFLLPLTGARLEIVNPTPDQEMSWNPGGVSVTQFVSNFAYSQDVVLNGGAVCYFDVFAGTVTPSANGQQNTTSIFMTTDGPPRLRITPFAGSDMQPEEKIIVSSELWIFNGDVIYSSDFLNGGSQTDTEGKKFDFLLNYLVARGGIPRTLTAVPPGMEPPLPVLTTEAVSGELNQLAGIIANIGQLSAKQVKVKIDGAVVQLEWLDKTTTAVPLDQSCSDSHYP